MLPASRCPRQVSAARPGADSVQDSATPPACQTSTMDPGLPSRAIAAFERASGLVLCFHDFRRSLWPYVDATRNEHVNPVCRLVKANRHESCIAFCAQRMRSDAARYQQGVVKRCHAGVIELLLPVFIDGTLEWLFYAGVRKPAKDLVIAVEDNERSRSGPWAPTIAKLPALTQDEAEHVLELLRQLAARLVTWRTSLKESLPALAVRGGMPPEDARRSAITWFISKRHSESRLRLADLGKHLRLSEDRAGHVVVELFGDSFATLLLRARVQTAQGLLRLSDLPLREVARQSGFGSRAHFFAVFREHTGQTPAAWRKTTISPADQDPRP
jgi:AraC-like DNA-binding protein